ncbi:MAG: TolC family protein [Deferribacteres bacterium]|nr:TolC family protein [Deferribacteres bacterium]
MRKLFILLVLFPLSVNAAELDLQQAIKLALKRNPSYKAVRYVYLSAKEREKEAWSQRLFSLSFRYSYTRLNEEPRIKLSPVEVPPLVPGMKPITVKPGDVVVSRQNVYEYKFVFFQPLFTGGALSTAYEMAKLGVNVEKLREEEARLDLIFKVKEAYFGVLKAKRLKEVAEKAVESLKSHYKDAKNFYEKGITPKVDLLRAEVALSKAKQALVDADAVYKTAMSALMVLIGERIDAFYTLKDVLEYEPFGLSFDECLKRAYSRRPVVLAVEKQAEIYRKAVRLAKADYYPKIYLMAEYKKQGDTPDCTGDGLKDAEQWSITGVLDWKFFEWGKTVHRVRKADYQYLKALEVEKGVKDKVSLEIREAYLKLLSAKSKIAVARKEVAEARENLKNTRERYRQQIDTTTDVVDAQTFFTEAQVRYFTALYDYLVAYARLKRAMGEEN